MTKSDKPYFAIYGNCQANVIASLLMSCAGFSEKYDILPIRGMHEMTPGELADFKSLVPNLSLLIYQNVQRGDYASAEILSCLAPRTPRILIPSLFFNAYNPEMAYLRQSNSTLFYHDRLMLQNINDYTAFESRLLEDDDFFPESFSKDCLDASLDELRNREVMLGTHIIISDYIADNFRRDRLFHVLNHPSRILIREVARRILRHLGINGDVTNDLPLGPLDQWQFPMYHSHYRNLGIEFPNKLEYLWAGKFYSIKDFFEFRKSQYLTLDLDFAKNDEFIFSKPKIRGWDLAGELQFV